MGIDSKISRRDFLGLIGKETLAAGAVVTIPSLVFGKEKEIKLG